MGGYQYLPFFTFGGFSTTNSNSRIATLGSQRSDFGDGLQPALLQLLVRAHRDPRCWGDHSLRAGYELRYRRWDIDEPRPTARAGTTSTAPTRGPTTPRP